MTDNEIIKALEKCADYNCDKCPWKGENCEGEECEHVISNEILDLIKRQQAEIAKAKSEAITEFAKRLKEKLDDCPVVFDGEYTGYDRNETSVAISSLVKEMVEGDNGT